MWNGTTTAVIGAEERLEPPAVTMAGPVLRSITSVRIRRSRRSAGRFDVHADHATLSGAFGAPNTKE